MPPLMAPQRDDTTGTATSDLIILGETYPETLDVNLSKSGDYPFDHKSLVFSLSLTGETQRSQYGMTYAISGSIVDDAVNIWIETEAMQAN